MNKKVITYGLYTLFAGVILYFAFLKVIQNPEHYLFGDGGDGLKNYFTFVDYIRNGNGTHFKGMNYPYGEHVIFTDNQPIYAWFLHWINHNIISIDNNLVGIYNLWLIFSIFLSGLFILKILKFFALPDWYAIIFSVLIMFLSPQLLRLDAHFTLSYAFYIPAIWYYLLRISDRNSAIIHYIGIGLIFFISAFTHLYFLAINLMLIFSFSLFAFILFRKNILNKVVKIISITVFLMGIVMVFISFTDNIKDRPIKPWGIDYYNASFESIFLPNTGFLYDFLNVGNQKFEGIAYVGIVGLIFTVVFGLYLIFNLVKNREKSENYFSDKIVTKEKLLTASLFAGISTLLYSTHFYHNIDIFGITDHMGPFSQFRSIGRFAWIFYYIYTVFISYYIYKFFDSKLKNGKQLTAYLTLIFVIVVWNNEARQNFSVSVEHIFNDNTFLINSDKTYIDILQKASKEPNEFQAILQIPYLIVGPEKWSIQRGGWTIRQTFKCSFQTNLPIMDIMMSRTSLGQSLDLVPFLGNMPIKRNRLKNMDQRPLLMLFDTSEVRGVEKHMLKKGSLLGEIGSIKIMELPIDSLRSNIDLLSKRFYESPCTQDTSYLEGCKGYFFTENFETETKPFAFNGKGSHYFIDEEIICKQIPVDSQFYELSLWLYLDPKSTKKATIYNYYSSGNNKGSQELSLDNIVDTKGYWVRLSTTVDSGMKHCLRIEGEANIDAIMIKPVNSHLVEWKEKTVYFDNCEIKKD